MRMEFLAGKSVNRSLGLGRHKRGLENDIKIDVCVCVCVCMRARTCACV